jgi:hypothetical protein
MESLHSLTQRYSKDELLTLGATRTSAYDSFPPLFRYPK